MSQRTILIVDDSPEDCITFRRYLTRSSGDTYRVLEASSARAAFQRLLHESPDCVLLDYYLPDMDGLALLALLKDENDWSRFPVIMLTGSNSPVLAVRAMQQGVQDYLPKETLTEETLLRAIDNAIEKHLLHRQVEAQREELRRRNADLETANVALQESRTRFQFLLNSSPVAIFTCVPYGDYRATYVSENVQGIVGYSPEQFCEAGFWLDRIHPEERERFFADFPQLFLRGSHVHDYRFRLRDGSYQWVHQEMILVYDANAEPLEIIGMLQDITERKEAEEALRASEQRLRFSLEASSAGLWEWDIRTGTLLWSLENYKLYDMDPSQGPLRYADWEACIYPEDRAAVSQAVQDVVKGRLPELNAEFRIVNRKGEVRWLLRLGRVKRDTKGKVTHMSGLNLDITQLKQQQQQIVDLTLFKQAQQEIVDLNARLHRAVFEGSHRIKNHLQVLGALVDMQLSDEDEQIPAESFRRLGSQIKALAAIHDVLTITTKENAENNILPMKPLLERILLLLQSSAQAHRIRFLVEDVLLPVKQASSLVLVLNELVSNAIKHGKGEVEVAFRVGEGSVVLEVCDDGQGFPPDFDARKVANTGLELVAAMAHIDLGGQVTYDNRPAGGGRVTISFPLPQAAGVDAPVYAITGVNTVLA